jgi:hypothetical protein
MATKLMEAVENSYHQGTLSVQSSITTKSFYAKRGFKLIRVGHFGEEPIILMQKKFRRRPNSAGVVCHRR